MCARAGSPHSHTHSELRGFPFFLLLFDCSMIPFDSRLFIMASAHMTHFKAIPLSFFPVSVDDYPFVNIDVPFIHVSWYMRLAVLEYG